MSNQPDSVADNFQQILQRLTANTARLESALAQTLEALRKRGFQVSADVASMVSAITQDVNTLQKNVKLVLSNQHQLQELVRVAGLLNSSLELDQVLSEVMDAVIALTGAERAYLMLLDKTTGELTTRKARNWDKENLLQEAVVFSRGIVDSAIEQQTPILTTNAQSDERFQQMQSVFSHALRSIICIPLVLRGETIGVLYADNRIGQGIFHQDSIPLLTAFANQAAIAIENARLFGEVKDELHTAQTEVQILRIQIDQKRMQDEIGEITETDYFQNLQAMAHEIRNSAKRHRNNDAPAADTPPKE